MFFLVVALCLIAVNGQDIDPLITKYYQSHPIHEEVSFLAILKEQANVDAPISRMSFEEQGHFVYNTLHNTAFDSQQPLLSMLEDLGVQYRSFWIVNMVEISGNYSTILRVATHWSVESIKPNFPFRVQLEEPEEGVNVSAPAAIEWNVARVKAPDVWAKGYRGEGFVVANADTGVQWNHPALLQQYRGYSAAGTVHDYNWWDAVHTTGSRCGANSKVPCDDNGHGTHTTGTAVGDDRGTNQIGVAPRAKWIACRNMNAGLGTPATYIECLQFFVAPTDLNGQNPRPELRPHVIGNSYGCPTSEGCSAATLQQAVNTVIAAGIFMSVSAGNAGSSCSTVNDPPAIYKNVFSVGALGYNSATIAAYSSRGPVTVDGSNNMKPEIVAPGSTVRSAYPTNAYSSLSGTSMASPHITGIVPLLWQARPALTRDILATSQILQKSAIARASTQCGTSADGQNNVYGYGEVDVNAAIGL